MSLRTAFRPSSTPLAPDDAGRQQAAVTSAQLASGAGNLLFAFLMVRILPPGEYAELVAFLSLYLLLHVFAGSLAAGTALVPAAAERLRARSLSVGLAATLVLVATAEPISAALDVPVGIVGAIAVATPAACFLAIERGLLYGRNDHRRLAASLATEPAVRLTLGLLLAFLASSRGAAMGVAAAGWCALIVADGRTVRRAWDRLVRRSRGTHDVDVPSSYDGRSQADPPRAPGPAMTAFLGLAVVLTQDVLWANRLLDDREASIFAAVSTLGGVAAFATSTIPLTLLGQRDRPRGFATAIKWAAGLGLVATLIVLAAPNLVVSIAFGPRFAPAASVAPLYVLAMSFLGVSRVLAAKLSMGPDGRVAPRIVAAVAVVQAGLIVVFPRSAQHVARATLLSTTFLLVALAVATLRRRLPRSDGVGRWAVGSAFVAVSFLVQGVLWFVDVARAAPSAAGSALLSGRKRSAEREPLSTRATRLLSDRGFHALIAITVIGLAIRLLIRRSVWLDEAIAVTQARASFGEMTEILRYGDVHPPLHSMLLWVIIRILGTSELAVRLPSVVAGTMLIPLLYFMAKDLYGRRTAIVAALFASAAPFLVWYSQEARMYALYMLFGVAAFWGQLRALRRGHTVDWVLYVVGTALLVWTHYFAILQVAVQQLIFVVAVWRRPDDRRRLAIGWAACIAFVAIALLPLVPILRDQIVAYGNRGAPFSEVPARAGGELDPGADRLSIYSVFANVVWAVWGYHSDATMANVVALWPLVMLLLLFLLGRRQSWVTAASTAVLVTPMAALFTVGLAKRDLFELRYFAGAAPLLILLGARVVTAGFRRVALQVAAATVVCATLLVGLIDQQTNGANPRIYDFRGALSTVSRLAGPADQVVYAPHYLEPVMDYYAPDVRAEKLGEDHRLMFGRRVFLLASFLDKKEVSGRVGGVLGRLRSERALEREIELPRVKVWVFR